jgi:hypothetical protein
MCDGDNPPKESFRAGGRRSWTHAFLRAPACRGGAKENPGQRPPGFAARKFPAGSRDRAVPKTLGLLSPCNAHRPAVASVQGRAPRKKRDLLRKLRVCCNPVAPKTRSQDQRPEPQKAPRAIRPGVRFGRRRVGPFLQAFLQALDPPGDSNSQTRLHPDLSTAGKEPASWVKASGIQNRRRGSPLREGVPRCRTARRPSGPANRLIFRTRSAEEARFVRGE